MAVCQNSTSANLGACLKCCHAAACMVFISRRRKGSRGFGRGLHYGGGPQQGSADTLAGRPQSLHGDQKAGARRVVLSATVYGWGFLAEESNGVATRPRHSKSSTRINKDSRLSDIITADWSQTAPASQSQCRLNLRCACRPATNLCSKLLQREVLGMIRDLNIALLGRREGLFDHG